MTIGTLCSGGRDGAALAAREQGMQVIWQCENDKYRLSRLRQEFPEATQYDDVLTFLSHNPPTPDIIFISSPCQDISIANATGAGVNGTKSKILYDCLHIADVLRPTYFVLENSPNILNRGLEGVLLYIAALGAYE